MSSSIDYFDCPKCGGQAYREQDNKTCEITVGCKCGWTGETVEEQDFDEWFDENKHSTLLQEKFLSCLNDDPDMTKCFRDWAKEHFENTKEQ